MYTKKQTESFGFGNHVLHKEQIKSKMWPQIFWPRQYQGWMPSDMIILTIPSFYNMHDMEINLI